MGPGGWFCWPFRCDAAAWSLAPPPAPTVSRWKGQPPGAEPAARATNVSSTDEPCLRLIRVICNNSRCQLTSTTTPSSATARCFTVVLLDRLLQSGCSACANTLYAAGERRRSVVEKYDLSSGTPIPFCTRLRQLLPRPKEAVAGQGSHPRSKEVVASLPPPLLRYRAPPRRATPPRLAPSAREATCAQRRTPLLYLPPLLRRCAAPRRVAPPRRRRRRRPNPGLCFSVQVPPRSCSTPSRSVAGRPLICTVVGSTSRSSDDSGLLLCPSPPLVGFGGRGCRRRRQEGD
jgi:hypothetical protein